MLVNKSKAAELAGVSRRTFYNHISKKGISITTGEDGIDKIDISELKRVYGHEVVLNNLQKVQNSQGNTEKSEKITHSVTQSSVQYEKMLIEERLKGAEALIEQLKSEREQLVKDKERTQEQLDKALEIGAPIGKLLTDQRENNEGRAVIEKKAIKESMKREETERRLRRVTNRYEALKLENEQLTNQGFFKRFFG